MAALGFCKVIFNALSETPPISPKKSIYDKFVDKLFRENKKLIPEMEKEIFRTIQNYEPKIATKRIMELIWMTRYEWQEIKMSTKGSHSRVRNKREYDNTLDNIDKSKMIQKEGKSAKSRKGRVIRYTYK